MLSVSARQTANELRTAADFIYTLQILLNSYSYRLKKKKLQCNKSQRVFQSFQFDVCCLPEIHSLIRLTRGRTENRRKQNGLRIYVEHKSNLIFELKVKCGKHSLD